MKNHLATLGLLLALGCGLCNAQTQTSTVSVVFSETLGPMQIENMALGQGGLSEQPMWADRVPETAALRPAVIRLFLQEYFDLLPERGQYHFESLDRSVDTIRRAGASPLMAICFKPALLFPKVDQDVVEPNDYARWEELIFNLVKHCKERGAGIRYWEVGNEPDIGEDGGCPYRFQPDSYVRYYARTVAAIKRADPDAKVGGPALAGWQSPILPALLAFCSTNGAPLDFVSWHIYNSEPQAVRGTIVGVKELLKKYPTLKPETFLDEWNMDLMNPPLDPRFQPTFICEVIYQMKDAGLDYSCYYHIRDWYVDQDRFARFMSPQGSAFMARWWNRMPQFDGLFDYQNTVRPSYFAFKLLSRLRGERIRVDSSAAGVHALASRDPGLRMYNVLLWNFANKEVPVEVAFDGLPRAMRSRHIRLDAVTTSSDENARLRPDPFKQMKPGERVSLVLEPYAVHYWSIE